MSHSKALRRASGIKDVRALALPCQVSENCALADNVRSAIDLFLIKHITSAKAYYALMYFQHYDFVAVKCYHNRHGSKLHVIWQAAAQPLLAIDRKGFAMQMAVGLVRHMLDIDPDLKHLQEKGHDVFVYVWPRRKHVVAHSSLAEMSSIGGTETYILTVLEWTFGIIKTPDIISVFEYHGLDNPQQSTAN